MHLQTVDMKTVRALLLGLLVVTLVTALGCGSDEDTAADTDSTAATTAATTAAAASTTESTEAGSAADPEEDAVRNFYSSTTKHGFATFHSDYGADERVEFWFDAEGRYRLTWYYPEERTEDIEQYGPIRIHMISPDGATVYHCKPDTGLSEVAYTRAEKQQWTFNGPPDWTPEAGVAEGEYTVFSYAAEKLWDIEGASQQFYLHDMRVYARDGQIEKVSMRTSSEKKPVEELVNSEFTIDEFELDAELPADVFELPFPLAES